MKNRFFFLTVTVIFGIFLSYLYAHFVIFSPQTQFKEFKRTVSLEDNKAEVCLNLPKDAYFLKIKHIIQKEQPKDIFINGSKITPNIYPYIKTKGIIETDSIYVPKDIIKEGKNAIDIYFSKNKPADLDIILSNYRKNIGNDIYILFNDSANLSSNKISFKIIASVLIILFLIFSGLLYLLNKFLSLTINRLFLYQIYSFLPFFIFLSFLWIAFDLTDIYKVVMTPAYFIAFCASTFFIIESAIVLFELWKGHKRRDRLVIKPKPNHNFDKVILWIKTRGLSDKCILLFMFLLILCALLLILHLDKVAEQFANVAYCVLIIGIVAKFVKFAREEKVKK